MPHAGETPGPQVLRQTKRMSSGSCSGQPFAVTPALCHDYPGPTRAMVQFPPLREGRGLQLLPSRAVSPEEQHELGLKRSHGAQVSGRFGELTATGKVGTPVALPTTKGTHSHQEDPEEPYRPPCRLGQAKAEPRLQAWSPQLCDPDHRRPLGLRPPVKHSYHWPPAHAPGCHIHRLRLKEELRGCNSNHPKSLCG